eukprot:gb/GECH01002176.1/.p1 GENE.gb/GECH01002176.1/~~gb/GECH01002176.1/.p1  ORF type:complete len:408 (+),score=110.62 gb/GECH01002176.1/:1-1224(+)
MTTRTFINNFAGSKRPLSSITSTVSNDQNSKRIKLQKLPIPEKIDEDIPESQLYSDLVKFEHKIDKIVSERNQKFKDTHGNHNRSKTKIRLIVSNTYENQDNTNPNSAEEEPSWTLRIEGFLMGDNTGKYKLTNFIKKVIVEPDKQVYEDLDTIEWHKTQDVEETDGFSIERKGSKPCNIRILIFPDFDPPLYKLSRPLQTFTSLGELESVPNVLSEIWRYIKEKKLQDSKEKRHINNDTPLQQLFGCEKMSFSELTKHLKKHLSPPDPFEIDFFLSLNGEEQDSQEVFDMDYILTKEDEKVKKYLASNDKELSRLDDEIVELITMIKQHQKKRDFMLQFHDNPVHFIHHLIASQARDLRLASSEKQMEESRYSAFYTQPAIQEGVVRYTTKRRTRSATRASESFQL